LSGSHSEAAQNTGEKIHRIAPTYGINQSGAIHRYDDGAAAAELRLAGTNEGRLPAGPQFISPSRLQLRVATVAKRTILGMFATAPRHSLGFREIHFLGRKAGAFVRAVTKRLALGQTAGAEIKRAGFHRQNVRCFLGNGRITHAVVIGARWILCKRNISPSKSDAIGRGNILNGISSLVGV